MHTGDLATMDERGNCRIVGRIKDMVIRHPDVAEVGGAH
jgi:fatty-acyl-CoA synthase